MRLAFAAFFLGVLIAPAALAATHPDTALNPDSLLAKSRAAEQAGKGEAALRYAQAAVVADPTRASTYSALADLYMREHDADSAGFYYAEALEVDPQYAPAQKGLKDAGSQSNTSTAAASQSLDKDGNGQ
jgi:tetratricopeptide (TPR) repeat protein